MAQVLKPGIVVEPMDPEYRTVPVLIVRLFSAPGVRKHATARIVDTMDDVKRHLYAGESVGVRMVTLTHAQANLAYQEISQITESDTYPDMADLMVRDVPAHHNMIALEPGCTLSSVQLAAQHTQHARKIKKTEVIQQKEDVFVPILVCQIFTEPGVSYDTSATIVGSYDEALDMLKGGQSVAVRVQETSLDADKKGYDAICSLTEADEFPFLAHVFVRHVPESHKLFYLPAATKLNKMALAFQNRLYQRKEEHKHKERRAFATLSGHEFYVPKDAHPFVKSLSINGKAVDPATLCEKPKVKLSENLSMTPPDFGSNDLPVFHINLVGMEQGEIDVLTTMIKDRFKTILDAEIVGDTMTLTARKKPKYPRGCSPFVAILDDFAFISEDEAQKMKEQVKTGIEPVTLKTEAVKHDGHEVRLIECAFQDIIRVCQEDGEDRNNAKLRIAHAIHPLAPGYTVDLSIRQSRSWYRNPSTQVIIKDGFPTPWVVMMDLTRDDTADILSFGHEIKPWW